MVNWIHFPKNKPLDEVSAQIVKAFEAVDATIDSYTHQLKSDEVLTAVRPGLEALGFDVEKSKKSDDLVGTKPHISICLPQGAHIYLLSLVAQICMHSYRNTHQKAFCPDIYF